MEGKGKGRKGKRRDTDRQRGGERWGEIDSSYFFRRGTERERAQAG